MPTTRIEDFSDVVFAEAAKLLDQRLLAGLREVAAVATTNIEQTAMHQESMNPASDKSDDVPILVVASKDEAGNYFLGSSSDRILAIERGTHSSAAEPVIQRTLLEMVPRLREIVAGK